MAILNSCNDKFNMGFQFGLESNLCWKRKFRWMFSIEEDGSDPFPIVPCLRGARPSMQFKETEIPHLTETYYYPTKPEWKTIELTFYDLFPKMNHPWFWMNRIYNPRSGIFKPVINNSAKPFKRTGLLELYDGCGSIIEHWTLENCYPTSIDWGPLDMESSDICTIDVTLRYDRAYMN